MTAVFIRAVPWMPDRYDRALHLAQDTDGTIVWDRHHDELETMERTLRAAAPRSAILLEDDLVLCRDWRRRIEGEIRLHGDRIIQFFSMRKADIEVGSRDEPARTFRATLCVYFPAGATAAAAAHIASYRERNGGTFDPRKDGSDRVLREFMVANGLRYWLSVPSLVQHEAWRSAHNQRPTNRQAKIFADDVQED